MSQIGYMIMAVSSAAYAAGMFHLMTHAFFKALLFMAAGSVISAMGGNQNLDQHGRLPQGDAVHVRLHDHRRPRAVGHPAVLRLLLQGRDPLAGVRARRLARGPRRARLPRRVPDRDLHVPDDLPRVPRRAVPGGARSSRTATSTTRPSRPTRRPARSRTPTSASPAPSTTSPSASAPMKIAMGGAGRCWRSSAASCRSRASPPSCTTSSSRRSRTPSSTRSSSRRRRSEWIGLVDRRR